MIDLVNNYWDRFKSSQKTVPRRNVQNKAANYLYIGKNESNLKYRLNQHIDTVKSTYAMKLKDFLMSCPGDFNHRLNITCYYYSNPLSKSSRNIHMLIRAIEGYYYDEMSPLIGSSK